MKYIKIPPTLTTYGKFLLLTAIVLMLACGTAPTVSAGGTGTVSDPNGSAGVSYTVTDIENSGQLANLPTFEIVRGIAQNTDPLLYYIFNHNLRTVTATVEASDGTVSTRTLPILWSFTGSDTTMTDTTVCGEYLETGIIQLPDASYQWGDGVLSSLSLPVRVYDPAEPIEIVALEDVWNEFDGAYALAQNSSIEDFLLTVPQQTAWPCYDADGNEYTCPVVYDTSNIDINTVGIYDLTATFEAPLNCRFADALNVPVYTMPVTVQAPGQPRLDLSYISPNYEYILFPWVTSGIDLDTVEVWMCENDGEWRIMEPDDEVYIHSEMLDIYAWYLNEDSTYQFQVKYEGGQTGIASFTYEWDTLSNKEYVEGDRDGGDTDGNPPTEDDTANDVTPEAPPQEDNTEDIKPEEPPQNNNTEAVKPEAPSTDADKDTADDEATATDDDDTDNGSDTDDTATVPRPESSPTATPAPHKEPAAVKPAANEATAPSVPDTTPTQETPVADRETPYLLGSELKLMTENLGSARFSAGTVMLELPADAIEALDISDTDHLLVTVLPLENHGFSIEILKNDIAVTTLSALQISLPYQPAEHTVPVLVDAGGTKVATGNYQQNTGLVTFTLQETGTFYIQDAAIPLQNTFTEDTPATPESVTTGNNNQSGFPVMPVAATAVITCAAGAAFVYIKKRRT